MAITIIILLLIASIAMSYSIWNLIRQNEDLEDTVIYYQTKLSNLRQQVLDMEIQLKEIDITKALSDLKEITNIDITFTTDDPNNGGNIVLARFFEIIRPDVTTIGFTFE